MKIIGLLLLSLFLFCSYSFSQNPCLGTPTVTYSGKTYNTVQIGSQCWLKENLDVGTRINGSLDQTNNSIIEKYCYNDSIANCTTYGGFYQWAEAVQYQNGATNTTSPNPAFSGNIQGICPIGWHIPKYEEFITLTNSVGGDANKLKREDQGAGLGIGTNTSGFSVLLSGYRKYDSLFHDLGNNPGFWSTSEYSVTTADDMGLYISDSYIRDYKDIKADGFNVRCIKDEPTGINDHSNITIPKSIDLLQNFPNPFNPSTTISFTLPERARVVLSIFNEIGEKVEVLFNGDEEAGVHHIEWNASKFVSGVYFYELKTEKFTSVKKLILMK
jgi:uncharacterized protein (TIGR02145 family)